LECIDKFDVDRHELALEKDGTLLWWVGCVVAYWQGLVADKVLFVGPRRCVQEIALDEAIDFVG
jgi:hypothetical protein